MTAGWIPISLPEIKKIAVQFSMERLLHFLNALGRDVQITVKAKPRSRQQGQLKVAVT
jgi:hypothetical protein